MITLHNVVSMSLLFTLAHGLPPLKNSTDAENNELPEATVPINYRLPTDILPSYYKIKLVPHLELNEFSFEGKSSININILADNKKTITLHAKDLEFDQEYTTLVGSNNQTFKPVVHKINNVTDFLTVDFETPITIGRYWLNLKYTGLLKNDSKGFFRTSYINENGEKVWLGATQFEATYARQAFPCFDEPAMKAKFEISIKHNENNTAISNMPAISNIKDKIDSHKTWTKFDVTPVMSTYLIAFVISDLKYLSSKDGKFRCWTEKTKIENCRYALEVAQKALDALEEYLGTGYIIPKIDNVVIPSFGGEAMENWGLVTYNEQRLLYEEGVTSLQAKQRIIVTICHELAHQWFGNRVSPAWWDDIWLNEGFSHYFQYFIADKVNPNERFMDKLVVESLQIYALLAVDYVSYEHPVSMMVNSPSEIAKTFDIITYNIGAAIIRMTCHIVTENVFQTALQRYIKKKEYASASADDLIKALVSTAENLPKNISLREYLNSWISQKSYPVIHVKRVLDSPRHVLINQTQYSQSHREDNITNTNLWWIPINYATESNPNFNDTQPSHWLRPSRLEQEVTFDLNDDQWFIVNKQQTGFYRVNYDEQNWMLIADYLNTPNYTKIHVLNRAQLLDDSFTFGRHEFLENYNVFLNISRYLAHEDDYIAWIPAFRAFKHLHMILKYSETYKLFRLYVLRLIKNMENKLGYIDMPEDDDITKLNRKDVIYWACEMGSVNCSNMALKSLIEHIDGSKKSSYYILCAGVRVANTTIWNKLFDLYLQAKEEEESLTILDALACSLDRNIIEAYLAKVIDPNFRIPKGQDGLYRFRHVDAVAYETEAGFDIILNFVMENFVALNNTGSSWYEPYVTVFKDYVSNRDQYEKAQTIMYAIPNYDNHWVHNFTDNRDTGQSDHSKMMQQIYSFLLSQKLVDDSTIKSVYS